MRVERPGRLWPGIIGLLLCSGCASLPPVPDRPEPIAYADTLPIPEPAEREPVEVARLIRAAASGEVSSGIGPRALLGGGREALNVDRFDDVPNSAWYERRNRARSMTPAEVRRGPTSGDGPADGPLTIVAGKVQGISPGFTVRDGRGDRYILKFDPKGHLYLSSAAGVISNRLLYAAGYHVPEDYIFHFTADRLRIEAGATYDDADGVEQPLTIDIARDVLTRTDTLSDGRYVAVASKFVPGPPKGPFYFGGVRADDANDYYPHEHRRELRGLRVVSSWINHVDMRFMNTLDAYVSPGYLRHYLIDFAATLGSGTIRPHQPREGSEYNFDLWDTLGRMFTLGFYRVGWESEPLEEIHPMVGWLSAEDFDPAAWKPNWPNEAFSNMTARDAYWGARLVGSFDDALIRAAIEAAGLPDPRAADTLATILAIRRDAVVRYWYAGVSPIENALVEPGDAGLRLRFDDAGVCDGAWTREGNRYDLTVEPASSPVRTTEWIEVGECGLAVALPELPVDAARLEVRIARPGDGVESRPARVYLRRSEGNWTVAGLEY